MGLILNIIGNIADVLGIFGFALTIVLLIKSEALRKEIAAQNKAYKSQKKHIKDELRGFWSSIVEDNAFDDMIVYDIRVSINAIKQKFSRILSREDKRHLKVARVILDTIKESDNRDALCAELAYFAAMMERVEIK